MKNYRTRKSYRLKNYNYSSNGSYFITICIKNKECLLGEITVGVDAHGDPSDAHGDPTTSNHNDVLYQKSATSKMILSEYGKITEKYIESSKKAYPYLTVDNYVIMPNHIHLIVSITDMNEIPQSLPCHEVIPKYVSSFKVLVTKEIGFSMWQRNYFDHVIRNEKEYEKIWDYIDTNPSKWVVDRFYMY